MSGSEPRSTDPGSTEPGAMSDEPLAVVLLVYRDAPLVHRIVRALDPFPVFLHCDLRTTDDEYAAILDGLPERVRLLPRRVTPWGEWGPVDAEIAGLRAALAGTTATHIAVLSGSDYPIASADEVRETLAGLGERSVFRTDRLPHPVWRGGGMWRFRYRHWVWRRHAVQLPVPRRIPAGVVPAGGAALKLLARRHAAAIVAAVDDRPDLVRFFRRTWCPDELFLPSVLESPEFVPGWPAEHIADGAWWMRWGHRAQSPSFLTEADANAVLAPRPGEAVRALFARKVSSERSGALLDRIDTRIGVAAQVR